MSGVITLESPSPGIASTSKYGGGARNWLHVTMLDQSVAAVQLMAFQWAE